MLLCYPKDAVILPEQVLGRDIWMSGGVGVASAPRRHPLEGAEAGCTLDICIGWGWRGGGVWLVAPGRAVQLQVGQRWVFCEPAL